MISAEDRLATRELLALYGYIIAAARGRVIRWPITPST